MVGRPSFKEWTVEKWNSMVVIRDSPIPWRITYIVAGFASSDELWLL
jgi:hypothetical protein